jgi:dihydrofolate synthase/folylpolyglutamate synthase
MKLQKIVSRLQELHPKEIDLSLDRIQNLCQRLGNPQDKLKAISIVGTNGKYSTIQVKLKLGYCMEQPLMYVRIKRAK